MNHENREDILIIPPGQVMIQRITNSLRLSQEEALRLHNADEAKFKNLQAGNISDEDLAGITYTYLGVEVLKKMFVPERLPDVIRRPAALFNSRTQKKERTALDLILAGKIEKVVAAYDDLLSYSDGKLYGIRFFAQILGIPLESLPLFEMITGYEDTPKLK